MATCETHRHRTGRLADLAAYSRLFESWSRVGHREALTTYQLGYLESRPGPRGRRRPPVPLLQLLVDPDRSIDFADPQSGFPGLAREPNPERVLTLWADDLLSVRHREDWMYVIDAGRPFTDSWLDLLSPVDGSARTPYAVVTAAYDGPAPAGEFWVADVDATTYTTLVRIEDLREIPGRRASRRRTSAR